MSTTITAIRFPFAINDRLGRLAQENDYEQYIKQLIRQVLFTAQGERINRPDFGAGCQAAGVRAEQPGHGVAGADLDLPGAHHLARHPDPHR